MVTPRSLWAAFCASAVLLAPSSLAHSVKRNPVKYISLVDSAVLETPSHRVNAYSSFDLTFALHGGQQKIRLALEPNHDVLHQDFSITHLNADGTVREVTKVPRSVDKVYRGTAYIERLGIQGWSKAGWARISVHQDGQRPLFDGAFRIDGDNHHILSRSEYESMRGAEDPVVSISAGKDAMVMWRDSDVMDDDGHGHGDQTELKRDVADASTCSADSLFFNRNLQIQGGGPSLSYRSMNFNSLFGRQIEEAPSGGTGLNLLNSIGSPAGCPTTKKVALVGVATDCNYFAAFNSTDAVKKQIIGVVNKASEVYERTFKISLAIKNLTLIDKACTGTTPVNAPWNVRCSDEVKITDRLNLFSKWRGELKDENAYWSLFTTCATQTAVGLAWRGMLCAPGAGDNKDGSGNNGTVAATNVVVKTDTEWQIFAHETGHTFGAVHDCTPPLCPVSGSSQACCPLSKDGCDAGGKYIMNPSTGKGITDFSPCSLGNICASLKTSLVKGNCLTDNRNVQTDVDIGSQCGNGIVEAGEDCDCGGEAGCNGNKCCDAKTCKFTSSARCDPSNEDCCTGDCQFAASGVVCRPSTGECDVAESCSGTRAACPDDGHKNDGDACGADNSGLQCASGQCTSRDLQCQHMANRLTGRNNTRACPDADCMLACTSPDLPSNVCMTYNQFFVDGTTCGGGGRCANGRCEGSSTIKEIGQWIDSHKAIFIPIVAVIGFLVLLAIASCVTSAVQRRVRRRRLKKKQQQLAMMNGGGGNHSWPSPASSAAAAGVPYDMRQQQQQHPPQYSHAYFEQQPGGGGGGGGAMYPPVPAAAARGQDRWAPRRSMRYA